MRAISAGAGLRRLCLTVLFLALGTWVVVAKADDPAKPANPDKPAEKPKEEKAKEKKYAFSMDNKPWTQVLEWFADHADLVFTGPYKPTGTFTFLPPKGKEYTISEIVDIINEALMANPPTQQYILIRRTKTFTLVPADEQIPRDQVRTVDVADLPNYGRTEPVRVNISLKGANAEDIAPILKKTMSKFSEAIAIEGGVNQLILIDTVSSLQEVLKTVEKIEKSEGGAQQLTHQCRYIKAREGAAHLEKLIGDKGAEQAADGGGFPGFGPPGGSGLFRALRYSSDYRGLAKKELKPTKTIEQLENPPKATKDK